MKTTDIPRVFTLARVERLGRANSLARRLKAIGYRIVCETPLPVNGSAPSISVDLGTCGVQPLYALGNGSLRDARAGVERVLIDGVWVSWPTVDVSRARSVCGNGLEEVAA
ncbi:hypothetical protein C7440_1779 [Pusillimonas noertemannii]|uniref:Uncharacterized protein n=1 Tax=Pusillimonas noertemannii TaxID=305977 RepID=A0A2U1CMP5_9BURK|nr:hypothetical protein C7440_1779 [Pusillimonas noertemannii]